MGELISAISQMNQSTALLAAKAFLIATSLVAVGGITFTWAVKTILGVEDVFFSYSSRPPTSSKFDFVFIGSGVW
jgi:hypothetical protein